MTLVPGSAEVLGTILRIAQETRTKLHVPGGAAAPDRPLLLLDRLDGIISVDEESRILHVQAGITFDDVESRAHDHGWTLGIPKTFRHESVGAWLARGAPGRADKEDDPVMQLVAGMEIVLPSGELMTVRPAPRRAVGPDLIRAVIGARGRLGVISGAHLVAAARSARTVFGFSFRDGETAQKALYELRGAGVRPVRSQLLGADLQLTVDVEGARHHAATRVMRRIANALGGREIENPVAADPSPAAMLQNTAILDQIAPELDPNAVLQP